VQAHIEGANTIRIATRASRLALWQANYTADELRRHWPRCTVEIVQISTVGDRDRESSLSELIHDQTGGVGVFTREIQNALLDGRADIAVHSLKDLPTDGHPQLVLGAVPPRAPKFDALLLPQGVGAAAGLDALPAGARVGTGSLRRVAQLLHHRSDVEPREVRGNVETRIRKLDEGEFDALILAEAGLRRLGLDARISCLLQPPLMYPAVGQGALGIECRADDEATQRALAPLDDPATRAAVTAERRLLACLRAGCHAPVGVATSCEAGRLALEGVVLSADGTRRLTAKAERELSAARELGEEVADALLAHGAAALISQ
jgi:hydroxymethylbilane synthase